MFYLTKVDFTKMLLFGDGPIFSGWHGEPFSINLLDVVILKHELLPLTNWRDFSASYPNAAAQNIGYVLQKAQVAQDHVLEAAALSELSFHTSSFDMGIEYLTTARDIILADIRFEAERLLAECGRKQAQQESPWQRSVAEPPTREFAGVWLKPCLELREIEELRLIEADRRETEAIFSARRELLELVENNLHQFILRQKSEFLRNRRICIDKDFKKQQWLVASQIADLTLTAAESSFSVNHWWLGVIERRLGTALLRQGKVELSREHLLRAEQILVDWVTDSPECVFLEDWQLLQNALAEMTSASS